MNKYIKNLKISIDELKNSELEKLLFSDNKTKFVLGFVSGELDFMSVSKQIREFFPSSVKVVLATSAGEMCNIDGKAKSIYLPTDGGWDTIVLQSYSSDMIDSVDIYSVDLKNEDIVEDKPTKTVGQRVFQISQELEKAGIRRDIDYKNTFAFTLIDGLSNSESFFAEAIYKTGVLPCNIVGGSSGGRLDFKDSYIFDNSCVVRHSAVISLIKLKRGIRFGVFKSQNFRKSKHSFTVLEADSARRYVKTIKRCTKNGSENFVDYLLDIFNTTENELEDKFKKFAFGIEVDGEDFIRSVSSIDFEKKRVNFYCDVDFGEKIYLYRKNDITYQTQNDFAEFLKNKPRKPFAGLLNDCILRRVLNKDKLKNIDAFGDVPLIGFSTFGEMLGVNINQTITALFFFEVKKGEEFRDEYVDNFITKYASFSNYFQIRELNKLKSHEIEDSYSMLSLINNQLEEKIEELNHSKKELVESEKMASLGEMVAGVAHEINTPVGMALTGITHLRDEISELERLYNNQDMGEDDFLEFLKESRSLSNSVELNLRKATKLVKSFKQVAVDQSSDENREFLFKEYVDEILTAIHNETKKRGHKIEVDIDSGLKLYSNPGAFSQIVTNLVLNSFNHGFKDMRNGYIKIRAFVKDNKLNLIYKDNGVGMSEEIKRRVYEPFFTTSRSRGGSGLGMNIVYNLVKTKLNGEIELFSKKGEGVEFRIVCEYIESESLAKKLQMLEV